MVRFCWHWPMAVVGKHQPVDLQTRSGHPEQLQIDHRAYKTSVR
jgi:hypothetical protein